MLRRKYFLFPIIFNYDAKLIERMFVCEYNEVDLIVKLSKHEDIGFVL